VSNWFSDNKAVASVSLTNVVKAAVLLNQLEPLRVLSTTRVAAMRQCILCQFHGISADGVLVPLRSCPLT